MGEAARKAKLAKAFEAVRETLWTLLGEAAERMHCERGDILALLLERGMLLDGFTEGEADRFIERLEQIDKAFEDYRATRPPPPRPVLPPLPERLGDAPVEEQFQAQMTAVVQTLDELFNGQIGGPGRKTGFVLLVFPFDSHEGRCNFMSNGAGRADIVVLFKEMIRQFEGMAEPQSSRA